MNNFQKILIFALFTLAMTIYGADMTVYGADTPAVNGEYINMGTHATLSDGLEYFQKGSVYLFRFSEAGNDAIWLIGLVLGDVSITNIYYDGS